MKKLCYLMLALPLVFAACNETPEEVKPTPEPEPTEDVVVEAKSFTGNYDYKEGGEAGVYAIVLSENGFDDEGNMMVNSSYYALMIYGEIAEGEIGSTITLPAGEYSLGKTGAVGTIAPYTSFICMTHDDPNSVEDDEYKIFDEAALVVTTEGLTFTAMIGGVKHTVTYTGSLEVNDLREEQPAEGVTFEAKYIYGEYDYYGDEGGNYVFYLSDNGFVDGDEPLPNSTYYCLDIYGAKVEGESNGYVTIPAGEYHFVNEDNGLVGSITGPYSSLIKTGDYTSDEDIESEVDMFEDAVLVVTADGLELVAVIEGVEHHVTYTGSLEINDCREPAEEVETKSLVAEHAMANYMGDYYNPGVADNFQLILSDLGWDEEGWELPNAAYYVFDLYAEIVDGELAIPYGTYEFDMTSSCEPNTIDAAYTKYILLDEEGWDYADEAYFTEGTLTVDANGIVAELVAEDGTLHKVAYDGVVTNIVDYSDEFGDGGSDEILSTLWEDWYCNFSNCLLEYTWYGDYYGVGYDNWLLYLMPKEEVGDGLQLDLLSNDVGLFELSGEYVISKDQEKFTAYPGYESGGYMEGSWYFNADFSQYAPLVDGDIYITNNGDTTFTIEVDAYDDAGNNIYGSWTGVDSNQLETFNCKSLVVNNRGMKNKAFSPVAKAMLKR